MPWSELILVKLYITAVYALVRTDTGETLHNCSIRPGQNFFEGVIGKGIFVNYYNVSIG